MLLRLPYLALTSMFTLLRLLAMTDRDKDAEILALRHQLTVIRRQIDMPTHLARPRTGSPNSPGTRSWTSTKQTPR